jgi:hypothetical protein
MAHAHSMKPIRGWSGCPTAGGQPAAGADLGPVACGGALRSGRCDIARSGRAKPRGHAIAYGHGARGQVRPGGPAAAARGQGHGRPGIHVPGSSGVVWSGVVWSLCWGGCFTDCGASAGLWFVAVTAGSPQAPPRRRSCQAGPLGGHWGLGPPAGRERASGELQTQELGTGPTEAGARARPR